MLKSKTLIHNTAQCRLSERGALPHLSQSLPTGLRFLSSFAEQLKNGKPHWHSVPLVLLSYLRPSKTSRMPDVRATIKVAGKWSRDNIVAVVLLLGMPFRKCQCRNYT